MKTKHTPAPWKLNQYKCDQEWVSEGGKNRFDTKYLQDIVVGGEHVILRHLSNARLIVAAPEMLEALKELASRAEDYLHPDDWTMIRKAIAKAEGETNETRSKA